MSILHPKCVLVPVDFSDQSLAAVDTAIELVGEGGRVNVVHVLPELSAAEPGVLWETVDDRSRAEHATKALRERLSAARGRDIQVKCLIGDPGHEIAEQAQRVEAELILMPSHGRRGLKRLLLGSVAERVLRLAHCPVLVIK